MISLKKIIKYKDLETDYLEVNWIIFQVNYFYISIINIQISIRKPYMRVLKKLFQNQKMSEWSQI